MRRNYSIFMLVAAGTVLGLMGTDLVLPAIPVLPERLGGTASEAQLVLAAYVAGTCLGLIGCGAISERWPAKRLLVASLASMAVTSFLCTLATSLPMLTALRAAQGFVAAAPAVLAPAIVKSLFDERGATRALGLLGSVESLAPALAPIAGALLLGFGGWQLSFDLLAILAAVLAVAVAEVGAFPNVATRRDGGYIRLLRDTTFLRYAVSQALVLGGLLTFVFGAPAVFVRVMDGSITDFIILQMSAIATFIVAANLSGRLAVRYGAERIILFGTALAASASTAQFLYALSGGASILMISMLAIPMSTGLGLRGPPGFFRAIVAARGDDARGGALVILGILGSASAGTALVSPWIELGMTPLASVTLAFHAGALAALFFCPKLPELSGEHILAGYGQDGAIG
ncbi:MAG TPA: MFS transporter [Sphingopyxis sp.]|nr:MFS transporter [Sphingopyxis sp.]